MTIGSGEQTNPDQEIEPADLRSELKRILADDFRKRLTESELISEEQCKRLCNLLTAEPISAPDIVKTLTGDEEPTADD